MKSSEFWRNLLTLDQNKPPFPWQQVQWTRLSAQKGRLAHALLLCGQKGLGKLQFANHLSQGLLCESGEHIDPCESCRACTWFKVGVHPDFLLIAPEQENTQIKIDQIRAVIEFLSLSRRQAEYKIVLIESADHMNLNAANSLLKILEEPPLGSLFILVSSHYAQLPATVRSRCQQVKFYAPPRTERVAWLTSQVSINDPELVVSLACGEPLTALEFADEDWLRLRSHEFDAFVRFTYGEFSLSELSGRWVKLDIKQVLSWLYSWVRDLVRLNFEIDHKYLENSDFCSRLHGLSESLDLQSLFKFHDQLLEFKGMLSGSLNKQLMLDDLLIGWSEVCRSEPT